LTLEEKGKETKSAILKSALECFSQKGYEDAQIDEICERAGVTKGAFYYHFPTKQEILLVLLDSWMQKIGSLFDDAKSGSGDFLSILVNLPGKIKPAFVDDISQIAVFLELFIKGISDPELKNVVLKLYNGFLDYFSDIVKQGVEAGYFRKVNPLTTARLLFSITIGFLIQGLIDPEGEDWENFAVDTLKLIFK
jgi:AcrR family transcriptional regulator